MSTHTTHHGHTQYIVADGTRVYHLVSNSYPLVLSCGCGKSHSHLKKIWKHIAKCPTTRASMLSVMPTPQSGSRPNPFSADNRAVLREHYINGRWATLSRIAKENSSKVRVHHSTTNLFERSYMWNNSLFTVVLSRNDKFSAPAVRKFQRAEARVQAQSLLGNIGSIDHNVYLHWLPAPLLAFLGLAEKEATGYGGSDFVAVVCSLLSLARSTDAVDAVLAIGTLANYAKDAAKALASVLLPQSPIPTQQSEPYDYRIVGLGLLAAFLVAGVAGVVKTIPYIGSMPRWIPSAANCLGQIRLVSVIWESVVPKVWEVVTGTPFPDSNLITKSQEFTDLYHHVQEFESSQRIEKANTCRQVMDEVLNMEQALHSIVSTMSKSSLNRKASPLLDSITAKINGWVKTVASSGNGRAGTRMVPLSIRLIGGTNVGKSTLTPFIIADVLKGNITLLPGEGIDSRIYRRVTGSQFWSGYTGQEALVFDDLGAQADTASSPCTDFCEIIAAVNSTPYNVPMADLPDKARTYLRSKIIVASSNKATYAIKSLTEPAAFYRRFNLDVTVERHSTPDPAIVESEGIDTQCYTFHVSALRLENGVFLKERDEIECTYEELIALARQRYTILERGSTQTAKHLNERFARPQAGFFSFAGPAEPENNSPPPPQRFRITGPVPKFAIETTDHLLGDISLIYVPTEDTHRIDTYRTVDDDSRHLLEDLGLTFEPVETAPDMVESLFGETLAGIVHGSYTMADGLLGIVSSILGGAHKIAQRVLGPTGATILILTAISSLATIAVARSVTRIFSFFLGSKQDEPVTDEEAFAELVSRGPGTPQSKFPDPPGSERKTGKQKQRKAATRRMDPHHYTLPYEAVAFSQGGIDKNAEQMGEALAKSRVTITYVGSSSVIGVGTVFEGRIMITPEHVWDRAASMTAGVTLTCGSWSADILAGELSYNYLEGCDIAAVWLPMQFQPKKDNVACIAPMATIDFERFHGSLITANRVLTHRMQISREPLTYGPSNPEDGATVTLNSSIWYDAPTRSGDCGGLVLHSIKSKPAKVIGMHVAGIARVNRGYAHLLTRERYMALTRTATSQSSEGPEGFEVISVVQPLHEVTKTCIRPSEIHGTFPITTRPSICRDFVTDGVSYSPLMKAIERYRPDGLDGDFSRAIEIASTYLLTGEAEHTSVLSPLDAARGVHGMEPMARGKSPGYPFTTDPFRGQGKHKWLGSGDEWFVSPELLDRLEHLKRQALSGERMDAVFTDCLKDERRSLAKADRSDPERVSTRLVSIAPMDFTLLCRQYLGAWVDFLNNNRIYNTTTAGINPHSAEWHILGSYITSVGGNVYDGDWKGYDSSLVESLVRAFFEIGERFYEERDPNITAEDTAIRRSIASAIATSRHLARGYIYQWVGRLPSGCFGTNQIDSVANLVIFIQSLLDKDIGADRILKETRFASHGDDNLMAVSDALATEYGPADLAATGSRFGMIYTPASKEDEGFQWKTLSQVQFLKRTFELKRGLTVAPLALASIKDTVQWITKCSDHTEATRYNVEFALTELAYHSSDEAIKATVAILQACRKHNIHVIRPSFHEVTQKEFANPPPQPKWGVRDIGAANPESGGSPSTIPDNMVLPSGLMSTSKISTKTIGASETPQNTQPIQQSAPPPGLPSRSPPGVSSSRGPSMTPSTNKMATDIQVQPDVPNASVDTRVQTVTFIDQVPPAMGADPYQADRLQLPLQNFAKEATQHSIADILRRPVPLPDVVWDQFAQPGEVLLETAFPDAIFTDSASRIAKLQNFQYFRCSVNFRVAPNAMPFHAGRLLLVWEPLERLRGTKAGRTDQQYATALKHVEINPNQHQAACLEVPFVLPASYWNLTVPQRAMGTFKLIVLNSLSSGVNTQSVSITPTYTLDNIEISLPTGSPVFQSGNDTEKQVAEEDGVISRYTHGAAEIASGISRFGIPLISEIAKPVQWIADFSTTALRWFGLSKPSSYTGPTCMIQTPGLGQPHMDGVSQAIRLSAAMDNELPMLDGVFGTSVDEMSIDYVISRPVVAATINWSATDTPGTFISSFPVHPGLCPLEPGPPGDGYTYRPTPLAFVASCFKFWTGSIRYRVEFVSTGFHAGRVLIAYEPSRRDLPAPLAELGNAWSMVIDISQTNEVDFEIPFVSNVPCLPVILDDMDETYLNARVPADNRAEICGNIFNGRLTINVLSSLVHADTVADNIDINVWVSGGSDMEFGHPSQTNFAAVFDTFNPAPAILPARGQPVMQSGEESGSAFYRGTPAEAMGATEGHDRESMKQLVPSARNPPLSLGQLAMGEKITSLRQLIKRLTPSTFARVTNALPVLVIDPEYQHAYPASMPPAEIADTAGDLMNYQSLYDYIGAMYVGVRGGVRYQVETESGTLRIAQSVQSFVNVSPLSSNMVEADFRAQNGSEESPITEVIGYGATYSRGPTVRYGYGDLRAFEFDVPQTMRAPFRVNSAISQEILDPPVFIERQFVQITLTRAGAERVLVQKAAAEDCTFGLLVGPPKLTRISTNLVFIAGTNTVSL